MPRSATLHLISGLPCAGKTTYAEQLAAKCDAAHFCLDRWIITAFGRYPVDTVGHAEHARRVYACRELILNAAAELLRRGVDVILDDGFFLRHDRQGHVARVREIGAGAAIHFVDTPIDVLRERLTARNLKPGDYHFEIAPEFLDTCVAIFETPSADEGADLIVVSGVGRK